MAGCSVLTTPNGVRPDFARFIISAPAPKQFAESLSGLIERVTFFKDETGFAVLKIKVKGLI